MNEYKVAVLMSTYNGQNFIEKQVFSILHQKDVCVKLFIRDDGSTDATVNIILKIKNKFNDMIELYTGKNIGFAMSFNDLREKVSCYDFYAFSDQDDIWYPDKLIRAIKCIRRDIPYLYASNLNVKNLENGTEHPLYDNQMDRLQLFRKYYLYNPFGCTMVWNNLLQIEMKKYKNTYELTHDVFVNIIANIKGDIYYDHKYFIDHLIHENNAGGITPVTIHKKLLKYYRFYFKKHRMLQKVSSCKFIVENFQIDIPLIMQIAECYNSIGKRLKVILSLIRSDILKEEKIKFIILILFHRF